MLVFAPCPCFHDDHPLFLSTSHFILPIPWSSLGNFPSSLRTPLQFLDFGVYFMLYNLDLKIWSQEPQMREYAIFVCLGLGYLAQYNIFYVCATPENSWSHFSSQPNSIPYIHVPYFRYSLNFKVVYMPWLMRKSSNLHWWAGFSRHYGIFWIYAKEWDSWVIRCFHF